MGRYCDETARTQDTGHLCADAARFPAQETLPAIDGTTLGRFEGNRGITAALRARGHGFGLGESPAATAASAGGTLTLGLTGLAALGLVLEILVVEEMLFSRCEDEIRSAIDAFEDAVLEIRHT